MQNATQSLKFLKNFVWGNWKLCKIDWQTRNEAKTLIAHQILKQFCNVQFWWCVMTILDDWHSFSSLSFDQKRRGYLFIAKWTFTQRRFVNSFRWKSKICYQSEKCSISFSTKHKTLQAFTRIVKSFSRR